MGKKSAEPKDPATPPTGPVDRPRGAARVRLGPRSQRGRTPLEDFAEELGRLAARDILRGPCMISTPELIFVLALVYAVVVGALHAHAAHLSIIMTALPN